MPECQSSIPQKMAHFARNQNPKQGGSLMPECQSPNPITCSVLATNLRFSPENLPLKKGGSLSSDWWLTLGGIGGSLCSGILIQGLIIAKIKLRPGKTISIQEHDGTSNYKGKNKSRNVRFNNKNEEQIGFIAELLCYHKLIEKYGNENVDWVSENAYRAYPDKFVTGEAGKGFDLELTENGKVRYIEIKGTSNIGGGIHMSKEEIKIALEFPEKYDLLIVEDPLSNEPFIKHIKMPFKFKRDESLFSNDKLKVFNDNYIIKFKWDSE